MSGRSDESGQGGNAGRVIDRRARPSSVRARQGRAIRSLVGSTGLLARRRARRDAPLLLGWVALLCLAAMLAIAVPHLMLDTVDRGARAAVADAGPGADVVVRAQVGDPDVSTDYATLPQVDEIAQVAPDNLPDGLARVVGTTSVSVLGPGIRLSRPSADADAPRVEAQFGLLGADQLSGLTLVDGELPADPTDGADIDVVVSRESADAASLTVGDLLNAAGPVDKETGTPTVVVARIVGIVASTPPVSQAGCAPGWCDLPTMWAPRVEDSRSAGKRVALTLLTSPDGVEVAQSLAFDPLIASVRQSLAPERFTAALISTVIDETDALEANASALVPNFGASVDVRTDFPEALREFGTRAAASVAQMSLMVAGLFGAVLAVMVLVSGLLVRRRSADLALERARGSSLGSVAVRGLTESVVLAVVGVGAGALAASLFAPGPLTDLLPILVVCAIAVLAPPVQAFVVAREAWRGRRQPANRRDRQVIAARARGRRIVLELAVVVLAVAALASVRSRGLVEARTDGTDPLLATVPLLLAIAVTVVILRVQPLVVRAVTALAGRSRGATGVLAAAHAQRAVAALPLLALTIAVGLVVSGSLVVQTVRDGQVDASWQRVGADARVEGAFDSSVADEVRSATGVTAASAQLVFTSAGFDSGAASGLGTLVAIDEHFPSVASRLPAGDAPSRSALAELADATASADELPVIVDERLAARVDIDKLVMDIDNARYTVRVVATFAGGPGGYINGPFVYADIDALPDDLIESDPATTLLVMGRGAVAAAESVAEGADVVSRADWLAQRRDQPLVQGIDRMTQLSVAAVALLAAIALISTVAAGSRSRSRSLSLLRTLGVRRGFGWVLAVAELAPLVAAALVGGAVAGIAILLAVGPAIGLRILAGGRTEPALSFDPWTVVVIVVGSLALCAVAIVVDIVAHRRDRPGDALRVGETT